MLNDDRPYIIRYRSALQNFTMGFRDIYDAIAKADELGCPVYDERKREIVYTPKPKQEQENSTD